MELQLLVSMLNLFVKSLVPGVSKSFYKNKILDKWGEDF